MDSLRRGYGDDSMSGEAPGIEPPPMIGQDERRMHVRAYNFWAKLLDGRSFPAIEALDLDDLGDFGPNALLLDFTEGLDNPAIGFVGDALARECELDDTVRNINDVPRRSLLSRLTDHYLQIIANRAPIGFEAEFVNSRGVTILYRGVLLPFSSDDDTIDFIMGVINWKQAAEPELTAALAEEMAAAASVPLTHRPTVPVWADGPDADHEQDEMPSLMRDAPRRTAPAVSAMLRAATPQFDDDDDGYGYAESKAPSEVAPLLLDTPLFDAPLFDPDAASLADWLASARDCAGEAQDAHARGHTALYQAIGRAWGFAKAAESAPEDYRELLDEAGIPASPRSPMTPVVKLVFGAQHDKTRLAEYAAVLGHASRNAIEPEALPTVLAGYDGGLKALIRDIRRENRGEATPAVDAGAAEIQSLLQAAAIGDVDMTEFADDEQFVVLVARREASGHISVVAQIPGSDPINRKVLKAAAKRVQQ